MSQSRPILLFCGIAFCAIILLSVLPVSGASETTNISHPAFKYKVQEDPYFTFAYPVGMVPVITSEKSRNTYRLTTEKKPSVTLFFTSSENSEWEPLDEQTLAQYEGTALNNSLGNLPVNLTPGKSVYKNDENLSSYFMSFLDTENKELIYTSVLSNSQNIVSAVLIEPAGLYETEYGNFTLKSLLSIIPRENEKGFTLIKAGTDKSMGQKSNTTSNATVSKEIAYDSYSGLYIDTDTGYYYLPYYGVFYDPKTGNYYYPGEFGNYDANYFSNYSGVYDPYGTGTGGYYDNLYSGYTGTSTGYDASGIISDVYTNRQNTYDAANAMWDDYIRGDTYYSVDSSGYAEPIDTIQEYQESGLS